MIRESGIANPEFGIPRGAHGAGILPRKTLRFFGTAPEKVAPAGQLSGYHDALHLVTQEPSDDPSSAGAPIGSQAQTQASSSTGTQATQPQVPSSASAQAGPDSLRSRSLESALCLPARRRLRLHRSADHQRLLPDRADSGRFSHLVARPVRLGRPSRQYPPDAPGRPVQPPHAGLGQEARDSGDRLSRRRTEA